MIYKYILSISGDNFYPDKILSKIESNFVVNSYFTPTDKKFTNSSDEYNYGSISFWHPQKFSTDESLTSYEREFVEFIEKNYSLFVENGVNDLEILIEIYFDGGQCNFEIFSKDLLKKLGFWGVSLPISIYILRDNEIQKWEDEIKLAWESR